MKASVHALALLSLLRGAQCGCVGAAPLTSDQPRRTITIKPMHTGVKRQQGALTVVSLMFVGTYSSFYEVHYISHDSFSLLT